MFLHLWAIWKRHQSKLIDAHHRHTMAAITTICVRLFRWKRVVKLSAKIILFAALCALGTGCKHPLVIVGEGDIVEANGTGRGCTLVQFRSQHTACTDNEVTGDYAVNYRAEPASGWRFVEWLGACAPNSDIQHCRLNVAKAEVDWWHKNRGDEEAPASIAVFERVSGETGYLLAGTPVAGIAWETDTQRGITGRDGSFHYAAGERVRFYLGKTLLGEVEGQERVTPFELAGASVPAGTLAITRALEDNSNPFDSVINLAVLLQSLDHDDNPENGIEIRAAVSSLFRRVKLDLQLEWEQFQLSPYLRTAVRKANSRQWFSVQHPVKNAAPAMDFLYTSLGIDARLSALAVSQRDEDGDGVLETLSQYRYDALGNLVESKTEGNMESRAFDVRGNLTREEQIGYLDSEHELLEYDEAGRVISRLTSWENAEEWTSQNWEYQLDSLGRPSRAESEYADQDGYREPGTVATWEYNTDGTLARIEIEDGDLRESAGMVGFPDAEYMDQAISYSVNYEYDAQGNRVADVLEGANPDLGRYVATRTYDAAGNVVRSDSTLDAPTYGIFSRSITESVFDSDGRRVQDRIDHDANGSIDVIVSLAYDDQGSLILEELDEDADGIPEEVSRWSYRYRYINGDQLRRKLIDRHADGTDDTTVTYSYHPNGELALERREHRYVDHNINTWMYDAGGNLVEFAHDGEGDGTIDSVETWHYENSRVVRYESGYSDSALHETLATWQYDQRGNPVLYEFFEGDEGNRVEVDSWQYDRRGNLTQLVRSSNEIHTIKFGYDKHNNLRHREDVRDFLGGSLPDDFTTGADGIPDLVETRNYNVFGNVTRHVMEGLIHGPWGGWDGGDPFHDSKLVRRFRYDKRGNLTREMVDADGDGTLESITVYSYDEHGRRLRVAADHDADGTVNEIETWQYDSRGNLVSRTVDTGADGSLEVDWKWAYDSADNPIRHSRDDNADGVEDYVETAQFDAGGNQVLAVVEYLGESGSDEVWEYRYDANGILRQARHLIHRDEDGVLDAIEVNQYQAAGWGYLLPPPSLEPGSFFPPDQDRF